MAELDIETAVQFNGNAMVYEDQAPLVELRFHNDAKGLNDAQKQDIAKEVAALVAFHLGWLAPKPTRPVLKPSQSEIMLEAMTELSKQSNIVHEMLVQFEQGYCNGLSKAEIAKVVFDKIVFPNSYLRNHYGDIKREQREARNAASITEKLAEVVNEGA